MQTKTVTVYTGVPPTPTAITLSSTATLGLDDTFKATASATNASEYVWDLSGSDGGLTGSSTTLKITITTKKTGTYSGGFIKVAAKNPCGTSDYFIYPGASVTVVTTLTSTVQDIQGHIYTTAKYGTAGWWTTQNLRTITSSLTLGTSISDTAMRYDYPGPTNQNQTTRKNALVANDSALLKAYGLLYTFAAASGRTTSMADDENGNIGVMGYGSSPLKINEYEFCQGICPNGWHLPSDNDWTTLEREIGSHPERYSNQTLHVGVSMIPKFTSVQSGPLTQTIRLGGVK
jgi:uncharacterized protein (TIGR02145 family)